MAKIEQITKMIQYNVSPRGCMIFPYKLLPLKK